MGIFDRFLSPTGPRIGSPASPDREPITPLDTAASASGQGRRYQLNTVGQVCPFPLVEAKQAIQQIAPGDSLVIDFDCTQATDSIPHWAATQGYPVTHFEQLGEASWTITVQKA